VLSRTLDYNTHCTLYNVSIVLQVGPSLADGCPPSDSTQIADGCGVDRLLCFRRLETIIGDTVIAYITHDDRSNISLATNRHGAKQLTRVLLAALSSKSDALLILLYRRLRLCEI